MDSLPIKYLEKLSTISTLKVLISILHKSNINKSNIVEYSSFEMESKLGISRNTIKKSIAELIELELIAPVEIGINTPNRYRVTFIEKEEVQGGFEKAVANKKNDEVANNIKNMDFNNMELLKENINSLGILNSNVYMTLEEVRKLSNKVVKSYLYKRVSFPAHDSVRWFSIQTNMGTDLLIKYRTEQVIAGIKYWTEVKGKTNFGLGFLRNEKLMMEALDYFKARYIEEKSHEVAIQKANLIIDEVETKKRLEHDRAVEEKEKVDNMSDDDFIKNLLGSFKKIEVRRD